MRFFDAIVTRQIAAVIEMMANQFSSYIFGIFVFAILTRWLLFPFSLWAQHESIKLAKLKPLIDDVKIYGGSDWRIIRKQTKAIHKEHKYSGISAMLPLLFQLVLIIGVMRAFGRMGALNTPPGEPILPILAALSAFALCFVQNKLNPLTKQMNFFARWGFAVFLTAFSLYFAIVSNEGFGVFWVFGNLSSIVVVLICNAIYNPKKLIAHEIQARDSFDWKLWLEKRAKQKADVNKFYQSRKDLVFYSEKSGYYKYFKHSIEHILENSNIHVHYLTSDYNDQVFNIKHKRFHAYYCGSHKLITVLMKLDCKVCVMSLPELDKYQYKRSLVNKDIEYIYVDHAFCSISVGYGPDALKYYNTVFCYGPNYNTEVRAIEKYYGSPEKTLVNVEFPLFEELRKKVKPRSPSDKKTKTIIVAPSWQKDNIFDICLDDVMKSLDSLDYKVILRPHPEYIKRFPNKIKEIQTKYKNELQLDFATDVMDADILITDWSTVAYEFSYATNKPSLFINTPTKIHNPDYEKYGVEIINFTLREKIGIAVDITDLFDLPKKLLNLKNIKNPREELKKFMYSSKDVELTDGEYVVKAVRKNGRKL